MGWFEVYVDSSVISGLTDEEPPGRKETARDLFRAMEKGDLFEVHISTLVVDEIMRGPEKVVREFRALVEGVDFNVVEPTDEARRLARRYIDEGILPQGERNDALHLAIAAVEGIGLVLSWNYEHMVNVSRIRAVNAINLVEGYRQIDVRAPEEVGYERD